MRVQDRYSALADLGAFGESSEAVRAYLPSLLAGLGLVGAALAGGGVLATKWGAVSTLGKIGLGAATAAAGVGGGVLTHQGIRQYRIETQGYTPPPPTKLLDPTNLARAGVLARKGFLPFIKVEQDATALDVRKLAKEGLEALSSGSEGLIKYVDWRYEDGPWYPGCIIFRVEDNDTRNNPVYEIGFYPEEPPSGFKEITGIRDVDDIKERVPGGWAITVDQIRSTDKPIAESLKTSPYAGNYIHGVRAWDSNPGTQYVMKSGRAVKVSDRVGYYMSRARWDNHKAWVQANNPELWHAYEAACTDDSPWRPCGWIGEKFGDIAIWARLLESAGFPVAGVAGFNLPATAVLFRKRFGKAESWASGQKQFWLKALPLVLRIVGLAVSIFTYGGGSAAMEGLLRWLKPVLAKAKQLASTTLEAELQVGNMYIATNFDIGKNIIAYIKGAVEDKNSPAGSRYSIRDIKICVEPSQLEG